MIIGGFQRFSLLEYPGQLSAVVFTQGCNFRCAYCHNPALVDPLRFGEVISEDSIYRFLELRRGKLDAVTITGGEPTLQPDLVSFIYRLKAMNYKIKLDTNGSLQDVIKSLVDLELVDYWAMDIKAPLALYPAISGCPIDISGIMRSMEHIRNSGKDWEFRTTYFQPVLSWDDILQIQFLLKSGDKYYIQQCTYENTLEPILNPDHSYNGSLFSGAMLPEVLKSASQYHTLRDKGKSQQIAIIMR